MLELLGHAQVPRPGSARCRGVPLERAPGSRCALDRPGGPSIALGQSRGLRPKARPATGGAGGTSAGQRTDQSCDPEGGEHQTHRTRRGALPAPRAAVPRRRPAAVTPVATSHPRAPPTANPSTYVSAPVCSEPDPPKQPHSTSNLFRITTSTSIAERKASVTTSRPTNRPHRHARAPKATTHAAATHPLGEEHLPSRHLQDVCLECAVYTVRMSSGRTLSGHLARYGSGEPAKECGPIGFRVDLPSLPCHPISRRPTDRKPFGYSSTARATGRCRAH